MQKLSRQEAKALGQNKCFGSVCANHPELEGFRWVSGACVACAREKLILNRNKNKERTAAQRQKDYQKLVQNPKNVEKKKLRDVLYAQRNKEKLYSKRRAWLLSNPGKSSLYAKQNRQTRPGEKNADTARRRASKISRTPTWLTIDDLWLIRQAYSLAKQRSKLFGFAWHVDHVVPLNGQNVSGLHVPWNLQVIPAAVNIAKSNKVV